ncbi:MAG: single-stranded-DNA-specific exonuclease RecJ [Cyanosarcina radialis HA8281-LM2]|nr:single-stranded-DNA-specific exonuclease RecJ [Cyanosarcina radialis HA8281-LM2]
MFDRTPKSSPNRQQLPLQRWQVTPAQPKLAQQLAQVTNLSPLIAQVLLGRGITTTEQARSYLEPESVNLPSPLEEFADLAVSIKLLQQAIASQQKIAICGDYDADGMTSTALLIRALRSLGGVVDYAIPSRMQEGYGINQRIVEEFHAEGVQLILTVDNGIAAIAPIARARELGLRVIVTDHHDLPPELPVADAILNPKLLPETSPYRGLAGVGVAYVLAVCLAQELGQSKGLVKPLLELFTLGTIADLAPLTGVNRRWVRRGLQLLPESQVTGIKALIQIAGVQQGEREEVKSQKSKVKSENLAPQSLKPEDIGFRLGPRINAVGRIADPQIAIELLTTNDMGLALERAMQCEQINQHRQRLCGEIEQEAIALVENLYAASLPLSRVLAIVQPQWHHGVIGIVASRLVERYGVPVFIGTYEDETHIRGSARGIPEFHVFEALEFCKDLLEKHGGHQAAGGFSLRASNLEALRSRLSTFARRCLRPEDLKPLLYIDVQTEFKQIDLDLFQQIDALHPCGIENRDPVFWTQNARVLDQQIVGKGHIKMTLSTNCRSTKFKAIAWRWGEFFPLPPRLDVAYKLRENNWNGKTNLELELVGARLSEVAASNSPSYVAKFDYNQRSYTCSLSESLQELKIVNTEGKILSIQQGQKTGILSKSEADNSEVDVTQPPYFQLIKAARQAVEVTASRSHSR